MIDRFTYYTLEFMEGIKQDSMATLADLVPYSVTTGICFGVVRFNPVRLVFALHVQRFGRTHRLQERPES